VFRNEKPGPGRFRQFMQFDADTVGSSSPAADAEMCMMAADTMEALGIPRGSYVVKFNNRKVLDGVLEAVGLGGEANSGKRLIVLRAIDKYDRLGVEGVRLLLGRGRKDESGDFTKGAELTEEQMANVMVMFEISDMADRALAAHQVPTRAHGAGQEDIRKSEQIRANGVFGGLSPNSLKSAAGLQGLAELRDIWRLISNSGYDDGRIRIDPSVVRGLEYYTGPVFEVDLSFPSTSADQKPARFGSVGGGGRYDGLVSRFRGEPVPATGFSIGVSRLLAALEHLGKVDLKTGSGPVVVTVFDRDRVADYQKMVMLLRKNRIRAELYLGSSGFNAQMKYANRRNSACVVIQGSNEKHHPRGAKIIVKDLIIGAELAKFEGDRQQYRAKQRQSEKIVSEKSLLRTVREVLGRYSLKSIDEHAASRPQKQKRDTATNARLSTRSTRRKRGKKKARKSPQRKK